MKRIDGLIQEARAASRNSANPDGTFAIPDEEFLRWANEAQIRAQAIILQAHAGARPFAYSEEVALVAGQEGYSPTKRLYLNRGVHQVRYSASGLAGDYVLLSQRNFINRNLNTGNFLDGYYQKAGQVCVIRPPASSAGTLELLYDKSIDDLDKRRAKVVSTTGAAPAYGEIILALSPTPDNSSTPWNLSTVEYVSICDSHGNPKCQNIPVESYESASRTLTISAGYSAKTGEAIDAGDWLTFHKWTVTHSQLPDEWEPYLILYMSEAALGRRSSNDKASVLSPKVASWEEQYMRLYKAQGAAPQEVPQYNYFEWY